jgi:signal transduction histidine kinase
MSPVDPVSLPAAGEGADPPTPILVVEDEPSVSDLLNEFLTAQGYAVTVAPNGEDAARLLPQVRPAVVITDINLPGRSGLEVMRCAKALDPEIAVIVITGYASASTAIDALRQGAYDYVTKPFDLDEVQQIVERGIATRRLKEINRRLVDELSRKNRILERHEHELQQRVAQAVVQMRALYDVGMEIGADLGLTPRLGRICARGAELAGARGAVLYLRPRDVNAFAAAVAHGVSLAAPPEGGAWSLELDGVFGPALRGERSVSLGGAPVAVPGLDGATPRNALAVPMVANGEVTGLLLVVDKPGGFQEEDERFLTLFGSQAAVAIRNSQLYEHTKSLDRLKSEFVAVVSHEIRTPITSIKGAVELLSDERFFAISDEQAKLLRIAQSNTERLLVLISDILDFSKLESASLKMHFEHHALAPVVERAVSSIRALTEERAIHIDVALPTDLPHPLMDADRITQVMTNLLSNAVKFSPAGGRVDVAAESAGDWLRVTVRDHGEGIPAQDLPKLFQKFSQVDSSATRRAGGTGLGLVICKNIVEQHGGRVTVESVPGTGSRFSFTLPTVAVLGDAPAELGQAA